MATPFKMVECPYNPSHRIHPHRLSKHLAKCVKSNKHMNMLTCPFNATHVVPTHQFQAHIVDCPDNDAVHRSITSREEGDDTSSDDLSDSGGTASIQTERGSGALWTGDVSTGGQMEDTEEWGAEQAGPIKQTGYDPKLASFMKPIIRKVPSGLSKGARETWRRMDNKRVEQLKEGVPFSPEVRAVLGIPDHLDTDLPFVLLAGSLPPTSGLSAASTSCQLGPERSQQPMRRPRISNPACPPTYATTALLQQQQQERQELQQERQLQIQHEQSLDQERRKKESRKLPALLTGQQQPKMVQNNKKSHQPGNRGQEGVAMSIATRSAEMQQRKVLEPPVMVNRARLMQSLVSRPYTNVARPPPSLMITTQEPLLQQQLEVQPRQQQHVTNNPDLSRLQADIEEMRLRMKDLLVENAQWREAFAQVSEGIGLKNQGVCSSLLNQIRVGTPVPPDQASVVRAAPVHTSGFQPSFGYQHQAEDSRAARHDHDNPNRRGNTEALHYNDAQHYHGLGEDDSIDSGQQNIGRDDYNSQEEFFPEDPCPQGEWKNGLDSHLVSEVVTEAPRSPSQLLSKLTDGEGCESLELVDDLMIDDLCVQGGCDDAQNEPSMDEENEFLDATKCDAVKKPAKANRIDYDSYKNSVADRITQQILSRSVVGTEDSDRDSSTAGRQLNLGGAGNINSVARRTKGSSSSLHLRGSSKSLYQSCEGKLHAYGSQSSLNESIECRDTSGNSSLVGSRLSLDSASRSCPRGRAPAPGASSEGLRSTGHASWADAARGLPANPTSYSASAVAGREDSENFPTAIKHYHKNTAEAAPTKGGVGRGGPSSSGLLRGVGRGILNPNWAVPGNAKGRGGKGKGGMPSSTPKM